MYRGSLCPLSSPSLTVPLTLSSKGIPCDLLTGEEVQFASDDEDSPAPHLACTVEMACLSQNHVCEYEVDIDIAVCSWVFVLYAYR